MSIPWAQRQRSVKMLGNGIACTHSGGQTMDKPYDLIIDSSLDPSPTIAVLIWAEGIQPPRPTAKIPAFLEERLQAASATGEAYVPEDVRKRVRKMLRHGKYKPSGRSKPASEFLLRAAVGESFPVVNGPVDVNNAISLESGFPGSIFDANLSGRELLLRRGLPSETYVFNPSGQIIDLQDLLLVCRKADTGWQPCGNPVRDSMSTKINQDTTDVIAVLYAPADEPWESAAQWGERFAQLLSDQCGATESGFRVIAP